MISEEIRSRLCSAKHLAVFTGAGMSAESGIPTFRDRFEGLWAKYDPQEVATPWAFRANPQFVWDWHVHLGAAIRKARPNPGHFAVAALEKHIPKVTVLTQNIDNLHQAAGSREVVELHGNLFRLKAFVDPDDLFADDRSPLICPVCDGYALAEDCDPYAATEDLEQLALTDGPVPRCPGCRALLRPDVVWFGEHLDPEVLDAAWRTADACDVMLCIGSSLEVEPAASLPWRALQRGALLIEINPDLTSLSDQPNVVGLEGRAAELVPRLLDSVFGEGV